MLYCNCIILATFSVTQQYIFFHIHRFGGNSIQTYEGAMTVIAAIRTMRNLKVLQ